MAVDPTGPDAEKEERGDGADDAHDHENHAHRVEVDPVLIGTGGDGEIENGSDGEDHEAGDESTGHGNPPMHSLPNAPHRGTEDLPASPTLQTVLISSEDRSEEHTSELQSLRHLVCCLLLVKNTCSQAKPTCAPASYCWRCALRSRSAA